MAVISQYQVVIAGQIITAALWNGMELNIINNGLLPVGIEDYSTNDAQAQTQTDPYPAAVLSKATDLAGEVARLRYQVAQILGETYWYIDPDVDLATFKTRFDAHAHDATANNGPKITVSGLADDAVETAKIKNLNVTTGKINDLAVTNAKIDTVAATKITGQLPVANGGTGITTKSISIVSYTGNATGGRNIAHGLGTTPTMVFLFSVGGPIPSFSNADLVAVNITTKFDGTMVADGTGITAIGATNVTIGANALVNTNTVKYFMVSIVSQ